MPQSLSNVLIHVVFSTKNRRPWLRNPEARSAMTGYWQNGYGAFSVSQSNAPQVKEYIANQEEHHRVRTFKDEFRLLLERHGISYDERYVWD